MANGATWHADLKVRLRRLRLSQNMRRLVRETELTSDDFVHPLFVRHGKGVKLPVASLPEKYQLSVDNLAAEVREIAALNIPAVILFGIPEHKDWCGSGNFSDDGIVPRAIRDKGHRSRSLSHYGYVLLPIHRPRALRHNQFA